MRCPWCGEDKARAISDAVTKALLEERERVKEVVADARDAMNIIDLLQYDPVGCCYIVSMVRLAAHNLERAPVLSRRRSA